LHGILIEKEMFHLNLRYFATQRQVEAREKGGAICIAFSLRWKIRPVLALYRTEFAFPFF
jgi:hypothetical protein